MIKYVATQVMIYQPSQNFLTQAILFYVRTTKTEKLASFLFIFFFFLSFLREVFHYEVLFVDIQMPLSLSEKSYCHPNPCLHGGKCIDNKNGYSCSCIGSYRGVNCEGIAFFVDAKDNLSVISKSMLGISRHTVAAFKNYLFIIEPEYWLVLLFAYLVSFNVFYQWMTVTSAIYMLYVFKERVDVELATKAMVSSAKRVSSVWKSILRFFSDVNSS